jgi:hypothetical protein
MAGRGRQKILSQNRRIGGSFSRASPATRKAESWAFFAFAWDLADEKGGTRPELHLNFTLDPAATDRFQSVRPSRSTHQENWAITLPSMDSESDHDHHDDESVASEAEEVEEVEEVKPKPALKKPREAPAPVERPYIP